MSFAIPPSTLNLKETMLVVMFQVTVLYRIAGSVMIHNFNVL